MRSFLRLFVWAGLLAVSLPAGTIQFESSPIGQNAFRITYSVSDITFLANQELDIRFDPQLYGTMSNGVAPAGFDLLLLQPNNPLGAFGDFSALALTDLPALSGVFSVDVIVLAGRPGAQPFEIHQLNQQGVIESTVSRGTTVVVPEPSTFWPVGFSLLIGSVACVVRRRLRNTA